MADASNEIQAILDIRVEADKAIQEIGKYEAEIKKLKDEQKKLNQEYNEGAISAQEYGEQTAAIKVQSKELGDASRALQKELRNENKVDRENEGSLKSLRAELSNLTKQYDELSRAEREGAAGKELQEKINATTKELKDAEEATTRYYRNVGNYKNSIEQALGANNKWFKDYI
jgi:chromosome segregation ATPase